jgi:cation diffusion facilitator family transporter
MPSAAGDRDQATREKRRVALTSLLAAVLLTGMKLVVGLLTGSLGVLSEAAHSGLDLVAAALTFFAVRVSSRPADQDHPYGHGKVENVSALFETLLLLVTCVWILYEAVMRLFFKEVKVDVTVWAFVVIGVSILIDFSRSRALYRVAEKYSSQALEADALHFSTDIWSSSVVLVGLGLVVLSERMRLPWLVKADACAAMAVAGIVVFVSVQLGRRTVAALMDTAPAGIAAALNDSVRVPGVVEVKQVRVRKSGAEAFVDLTVTVSRDTSFERAHDIATQAEEAARQVVPGADVVVHVDPVPPPPGEGTAATVRLMAARRGLGAHGIRVYHVEGRVCLELHLEVGDSLSVAEAHAQATAFEQALRAALPEMDHIVTHIEPAGEGTARCAAIPGSEIKVEEVLRSVADTVGMDCRPHDVRVYRVAGELAVSFHCAVPAGTAIADAHAFTETLEKLLRERLRNLGRVVIHVEPPEV